MKCEACGHENGRKYNPIRRIISLLEARGNTLCQKRLKRIIKIIRTQVVSDSSNQKTFYFLQAISKVPNHVVERIVGKYEMDEHAYNGKGFAYLQKMIISENENASKLLENEIKKFGRTPKKTKVERGEYKDVYSNNGGNTISS